MRKNTMKEKLAAGETVIGFSLLYDWPEMVQMAAHLGADYVKFDGEHGYLGVPEIARLVRAAESVNITPIARVPRNSPDVILRYLDAGVQGVVVPNVSTAEQARDAVAATKYHPEGNRGTGYGHPMEWMINTPFSEYHQVANRETMVFTQCESAEGVANIEEILKVPGVDAIMMGPNDLAQSLGHPGKFDHPEVLEGLARARKATLDAGKYVASPAMSGEAARKAISEGSKVIIIGGHRLFIDAARQYLSTARSS